MNSAEFRKKFGVNYGYEVLSQVPGFKYAMGRYKNTAVNYRGKIPQ
jgi:hypothetical protein